MSLWFLILCQFSLIAYATLGGVFLAFSDFIMRSLYLTSGSGGIEAMQVINREVFRWVFMTGFMGMALVSLGLGGYAAAFLKGPGTILLILAAVVYLVGVFGVTVGFNVPLNTALDGMDLTTEATRRFWSSRYVPDWTFWNSVRTVGCIASAALCLAAVTFLVQVRA